MHRSRITVNFILRPAPGHVPHVGLITITRGQTTMARSGKTTQPAVLGETVGDTTRRSAGLGTLLAAANFGYTHSSRACWALPTGPNVAEGTPARRPAVNSGTRSITPHESHSLDPAHFSVITFCARVTRSRKSLADHCWWIQIMKRLVHALETVQMLEDGFNEHVYRRVVYLGR